MPLKAKMPTVLSALSPVHYLYIVETPLRQDHKHLWREPGSWSSHLEDFFRAPSSTCSFTCFILLFRFQDTIIVLYLQSQFSSFSPSSLSNPPSLNQMFSSGCFCPEMSFTLKYHLSFSGSLFTFTSHTCKQVLLKPGAWLQLWNQLTLLVLTWDSSLAQEDSLDTYPGGSPFAQFLCQCPEDQA